MALKSRLGFGMMRLPVKNGNPTDFDYDELNRMVDTFIEAGYTYFDTSYVYNGTLIFIVDIKPIYIVG
ncbi:MAG: aldo/keto reductase [Clostridia bacterium]|nr:aldo/keto reductase [Clostridia bacterium]